MSAGSVDDVRIGFTAPINPMAIGPDQAHVDIRAQWGQAAQPGVTTAFDAKGPAIQPVLSSDDIWADINKQNPGMPIEQSAAAVGHNLRAPNEGLARIGEELSKDIGEGISQVMNLFRTPEPDPAPQVALNRFAPQPMQPNGGSIF